jgi:hypothetical protein
MPEIQFPDPLDPAFRVRRVGGGDYARSGSLVGTPEEVEDAQARAAVLRYSVFLPEGIFADALLLSQPVGYDTVQVWWGVPPEAMDTSIPPWSTMAVVRSGFGHPSTPSDGEIVYIADRPSTGYVAADIPGTFKDGPPRGPALTAGRRYYYTLFFRVGNRWFASGQTQSLVPIDYGHRDHLLGLVPPFYLEREANDGYDFIRRWMTMIGYDLDYTRSLAEGVQQIYDPDSAPQALLDALGQNNLGFAKPSAMGDIRYRSVIANNRSILFHRGTVHGLQSYMESVFKSKVTVSNGLNELLLVDDAEFVTGVGNWAPMPWRIGYELASSRYGAQSTMATPLATNKMPTRGVKLESFVERVPPDVRSWSPVYPQPPSTPGDPTTGDVTSPWPVPVINGIALPSRGVLKIQTTNSTDQLAITCGAGQQDVIVGVDSANHTMERDEQHLDSFYRGIPVDIPNDVVTGLPFSPTYYFSFWSRREPENVSEVDEVVYGFMQYDRDPASQGFSDGFRAVGPTVVNTPPAAVTALNTRRGFNGWQARGTAVPPVDGIGVSGVTVGMPTALLMTRRDDRTGSGWEHHMASFPLSTGTAPHNRCRYIVPFIWFHKPYAGGGAMPLPITTPRYITGVMVNKSQGAGADRVFQPPDGYLKLTFENTARNIIGGPGEDSDTRTDPPYKAIGEPT